MARILVTGGSGFIGTNLVDSLISAQHEILSIDIAPPRNNQHINLWKQIDILDRKSLRDAVLKFNPDFCLHMAARTDLEGKCVEDYAVNTIGVENIIDVLLELKTIKRVVFASSMLVCQLGYMPKSDVDYKPNTYYGRSKIVGEKLVREKLKSSISWIIIRPTSIWGPSFGIPYRNFFDVVEKGLFFHSSKHRIRRSYGFVYNSVRQIECLLFADDSKVNGRMFYIADYEPLEVATWAELIREEMRAPSLHEVPLWVLRTGALFGDVLKLFGIHRFPLTSFRLKNLLTNAVYDTDELEKVCGNQQFTIEDGVQLTVSWMKHHKEFVQDSAS